MYPNLILTTILTGVIFWGDVSMTFHFHTLHSVATVPGRARRAEPGAGSPAVPGAVGPRCCEALGGPGAAAQRHGAADAESQPQPGLDGNMVRICGENVSESEFT